MLYRVRCTNGWPKEDEFIYEIEAESSEEAATQAASGIRSVDWSIIAYMDGGRDVFVKNNSGALRLTKRVRETALPNSYVVRSEERFHKAVEIDVERAIGHLPCSNQSIWFRMYEGDEIGAGRFENFCTEHFDAQVLTEIDGKFAFRVRQRFHIDWIAENLSGGWNVAYHEAGCMYSFEHASEAIAFKCARP